MGIKLIKREHNCTLGRDSLRSHLHYVPLLLVPNKPSFWLPCSTYRPNSWQGAILTSPSAPGRGQLQPPIGFFVATSAQVAPWRAGSHSGDIGIGKVQDDGEWGSRNEWIGWIDEWDHCYQHNTAARSQSIRNKTHRSPILGCSLAFCSHVWTECQPRTDWLTDWPPTLNSGSSRQFYSL